MINIIGAFIAVLFTYFAMYLSAAGAGVTFMGYVDTVSLLLCIGIPYGCALAAFGKIIPDLDGMQLMNKLFLPVGWFGTIIGWVMMLFGMSTIKENLLEMFSLSMAVSITTLLYALALKVIFITILATKK